MVLRTGSRRFPSTNYKTSNHIIAYLDILGAKNMICDDEDFKFLNHLNMFMEDAIEESGRGIFPGKYEIYVKMFSDNILLVFELKENDECRDDKVAALFNAVANIYNEILRYGYLMRGAIVEGEFFHDDIIVYGKALVEAVRLEEKEAIYPRILVKRELIEPLQHYLIQDRDGWYILNVFQFGKCFDHITFKANILDMLKKYKDNEHIKSKIMWVITYFNCWYGSRTSVSLERPQITEEEIENNLK